MKQFFVSVLFFGLISAQNAYAEVAYNYSIYSSEAAAAHENKPANTSEVVASSSLAAKQAAATTTAATSTHVIATTTEAVPPVSEEAPLGSSIFRGVGSKFQTLIAPPPAAKLQEKAAPVSLEVMSTSTPSEDLTASSTALSESPLEIEAAKSAQALQQSAQNFEDATRPITTKIKQIVMKILSIFSW